MEAEAAMGHGASRMGGESRMEAEASKGDGAEDGGNPRGGGHRSWDGG